jgi:hypothetical protein
LLYVVQMLSYVLTDPFFGDRLSTDIRCKLGLYVRRDGMMYTPMLVTEARHFLSVFDNIKIP